MTRSRDSSLSVQPPGWNGQYFASARQGGVLLWVLPALAALAVATIWLATPGQPESASSQAAALQSSARTAPPMYTDKPLYNPAVSLPGRTTAAAQTAPKSPLTEKGDGDSKQPVALAEAHHIVKGEWTSFYQGQRRLIVLDDGTATMVVEPEGLGAVLLAPKITFEVLWKINGDQLEFETVGGDPLDKVNVVVKMYGKHRKHKIVRLEPDQIVLLDEDGVTEYVWTRVAMVDS